MAPNMVTRQASLDAVDARLDPKPPVLIVFLDVDGVLHPFRYAPRNTHDLCSLDPNVLCCKDILEQAVREIESNGVEVRIVLTTAWRIYFTPLWLGLLLDPFLGSRLIGVTPDLDEHRRDLEIIQFQERRSLCGAASI